MAIFSLFLTAPLIFMLLFCVTNLSNADPVKTSNMLDEKNNALPSSQRDVLNFEATIDEKASFTGQVPNSTYTNQDINSCKDLHSNCDSFADAGECERNPGIMTIYCAMACNMCHLRDRMERCKKEQVHNVHDRFQPLDNANLEYMHYNRTLPIYLPGDLNRMFESILPRFEKRYEINYLSRSPYIVTIDNFLNDQEVRSLTKHVTGWERSTDSGEVNFLGASGKKLSAGRTSSNAWCQGACETHPDVVNIYNKIAEVTKVPRSYYETFQVLRYEIGQKYEVHHDNGVQSKSDENSAGPRMLTFFLYLSDVDEGGETVFPALGIAVQPKRGRALLWPSVTNANVLINDGRTIHEARPVIRGRKFAANTWIHAFDFQLASSWLCTGGSDGTLGPDFMAGLIN